eukprot:383026_1
MDVQIVSLSFQLLFISCCIRALSGGEVPSGACFVPTKLSAPSQDLPKPLISPQSPGYKDIFAQFIDPMLISMAGANLGIMNSSREYAATAHGVKTKQQKISEYRKMRKSVEVYFIDHFNDPRNSDISLGIWQISFGQFVFKFTEPIAGIPDTIIFNGLLPAVGLT